MGQQINPTIENIQPHGLYDASESMELLGVKPSTFYRHIREGKIKYKISKRNGRKVFRGRDLMNYQSGTYSENNTTANN